MASGSRLRFRFLLSLRRRPRWVLRSAVGFSGRYADSTRCRIMAILLVLKKLTRVAFREPLVKELPLASTPSRRCSVPIKRTPIFSAASEEARKTFLPCVDRGRGPVLLLSPGVMASNKDSCKASRSIRHSFRTRAPAVWGDRRIAIRMCSGAIVECPSIAASTSAFQRTRRPLVVRRFRYSGGIDSSGSGVTGVYLGD